MRGAKSRGTAETGYKKTTPVIEILLETDRYQSEATAYQMAELAADARALERWRDTEPHSNEATEAVRTFLRAHVPKDAP